MVDSRNNWSDYSRQKKSELAQKQPEIKPELETISTHLVSVWENGESKEIEIKVRDKVMAKSLEKLEELINSNTDPRYPLNRVHEDIYEITKSLTQEEIIQFWQKLKVYALPLILNQMAQQNYKNSGIEDKNQLKIYIEGVAKNLFLTSINTQLIS